MSETALCENGDSPQFALTPRSRIATGSAAVFPVVHTPYDYEQRV
jgi:hypothetical protein